MTASSGIKVYCFHCGEKFSKPSIDKYEKCPKCGKGFEDLNEQAQYAVNQVMRAWIENTKK